MKPYYEHAGITIFHGDCRELLPSITADFVLSDVPYGINYQGGGGGNLIHTKRHRRQEKIKGDDKPFDPSPLLRFTHVALFGAQHFYSRLPDGGTFHIWDKRGPYEEFHTADFDSIWINRKEVGRIVRCVWRGLCRDTEAQDKILHPTQKPKRVVRWAMEMFQFNTVVDPYMGSGTTLVVAKELGRNAIGIEIEERYCEVAAKRLSQEVLAL